MKKSFLAGFLALAMVSWLGLASGWTGQKPPGDKNDFKPKVVVVPGNNDFKGKVLVVMTKALPPGAVLEKASIRELAQRFFLVGKAPEGDARWAGSTIWLAMDDVSMIASFDTLEEARKAINSER